jgi:hypothetical protein
MGERPTASVVQAASELLAAEARYLAVTGWVPEIREDMVWWHKGGLSSLQEDAISWQKACDNWPNVKMKIDFEALKKMIDSWSLFKAEEGDYISLDGDVVLFHGKNGTTYLAMPRTVFDQIRKSKGGNHGDQ